MKKRLTVISPVFNEVEVIESFYRELKVCLRGLEPRYDTQILLVLDRCTDDTVSVVRHLAADDLALRCLVLSSRFGHQMSLLAGLDHASADIYVMMDSDLQHPPSLIPEMVRAYEEGFDVVYTVRRESGPQPFWRRVAGKAFYGLLHRVSDAPIHENAADFRLMTEKIARIFRTDIRERKMFMRGLISWVGFNQKMLEYSAATRPAGASKVLHEQDDRSGGRCRAVVQHVSAEGEPGLGRRNVRCRFCVRCSSRPFSSASAAGSRAGGQRS